MGLWDCHGKKNQQLVSGGSGKWCVQGNCIIVSDVSPDPKVIQNMGNTSCLKAKGHGQPLTEDGNSGCANFRLIALTAGTLFSSIEVPGSCLDWFEGQGWGLWSCHGGQNQQFESRASGEWCAQGNCIIVPSDLSPDLNATTTTYASTATTSPSTTGRRFLSSTTTTTITVTTTATAT